MVSLLLDSQLQFVNMAILLYDQLEVITIFQTFLLFSWSIQGMIVFNEYRYYETIEIAQIFAAAFICSLGLKALLMKHQQLSQTPRHQNTQTPHNNNSEEK